MFKKIFDIITTVLVAAVVVLAILLGGVRLIGFTPYTILSPSMSPKYLPGDLVYVKKTDPEKIEAGDVLTFVANDELTVVTHRVAEVDRESRCFYTKGDANDTRDASPVLYENALGTVRFSIPKLGFLANYLSGTRGKYVAVAVLCVLALIFVIPDLFKPKKNDSVKESEKTEIKDPSEEDK